MTLRNLLFLILNLNTDTPELKAHILLKGVPLRGYISYKDSLNTQTVAEVF